MNYRPNVTPGIMWQGSIIVTCLLQVCFQKKTTRRCPTRYPFSSVGQARSAEAKLSALVLLLMISSRGSSSPRLSREWYERPKGECGVIFVFPMFDMMMYARAQEVPLLCSMSTCFHVSILTVTLCANLNFTSYLRVLMSTQSP